MENSLVTVHYREILEDDVDLLDGMGGFVEVCHVDMPV
jgi:hypothetical protein